MGQQGQTEAMRSLQRVATHLSKHDDAMPLTRLQVFLYVALNEGCLVVDIQKRVGIDKSSVTRNLALLSNKPVRGVKDGLRWVEVQPDHEDPRRVRCFLTSTGKQLVDELNDLME